MAQNDELKPLIVLEQLKTVSIEFQVLNMMQFQGDRHFLFLTWNQSFSVCDINGASVEI
jgi:hypothetical protein